MTRYVDDHAVALFDEAQLTGEYQRLANQRASIQAEITGLNNKLSSLKSHDRSSRSDLQKQISVRQQQLGAVDEQNKALDESYGRADARERLFADYESLKMLAKNFRGRSYDLATPTDREALKVAMLSSIRPPALRILEEVSSTYHHQFNRPLPVSSLVRPEEYQHTLRRYNRAAVLIDTPPHSTGLAFDIDYRYMSVAEQNFVMNFLAQLKRDGRVEVLRERAANFHVFAFSDGVRPNDELIRASLVDVDPSLKKDNDATDVKTATQSPKSRPTAKPKDPVIRKQRKRR